MPHTQATGKEGEEGTPCQEQQHGGHFQPVKTGCLRPQLCQETGRRQPQVAVPGPAWYPTCLDCKAGAGSRSGARFARSSAIRTLMSRSINDR